MKGALLLLAAVCFAVSCGESVNPRMTVRTVSQDHTFLLQARGEIVSSESIPISVPHTVSMQLNIEWILPEYTAVSKGDLVVRFEADEIATQRGNSLVSIANQSLFIRNHMMDSATAHTKIEHEGARVAGETVIAQTFADFDPRYFSRIEIIDAIGDLDFLGVEASFYDWQSETHDQRTTAETARIQAERSSVELQLSRQENALDATELRSPVDGIFLHARTPWGEKLGRGRPAYPGMAVGMLPVDGKLEARIYVPKIDAIGIEVGQLVKLLVDADVDRELTGKVESVSPMAISRNPRDPRQYVLVSASLNDGLREGVRIGSALTATIVTANLEKAIVLPQQAVFNVKNESVVYVMNGGRLNARTVELGRKSPTLVEVAEGLSPGELVSLIAPVGIDA